MTRETRTRITKGNADPGKKGCILLPVFRAPKKTPKVHSSIADCTFYRFNLKRQRVECLVSQDEGGLLVAWDTCGVCINHFTKCKCPTVAPSQSILHLLNRHDAWDAISRAAAFRVIEERGSETKGKPLPKSLPQTKGKPLPALNGRTRPLPPLKRPQTSQQRKGRPLPPLRRGK